METKELMTGFWVLINGVPKKIQTVDGVNNEIMADDEIYCLAKDKVTGIPLTPGILEKNGWKNISDHTLKGCETFRLHIEQASFDYTLTLKLRDYFRFDSYDDRVYTLCEVNFGFKYAHQLQNALRLCGIEKEIII